MTQVIDTETGLESIIEAPTVKLHMSSRAGDGVTAIRDLTRKLSVANAKIGSSSRGVLSNPTSVEYTITYNLGPNNTQKHTSKNGFRPIEERARVNLNGNQISSKTYRVRQTFEVTPTQHAAATSPLSAYAGPKKGSMK